MNFLEGKSVVNCASASLVIQRFFSLFYWSKISRRV